MAGRVELRPLPPEEAIGFFRRKGLRPSFSWRDVWQEEHAKAFTVAKGMRQDVVEAIYNDVRAAIEGGLTFRDFRRQLEPRLRRLGWWGRGPVFDPRTGETVDAQLGSPRRLRTIFDVNMRTSYAAGQWERIQRTKATRPYLRYTAVRDERTRPQHRAWHGTVRPVDDGFWSQHYPPNGWNCRCSVVQLSRRDLNARGWEVADLPPSRTRTWHDRRTGRVEHVPDGIDPGFAYNVGRAHLGGVSPPPLTGSPAPAMLRFETLPPLPAPEQVRPSAILPAGRDDAYYLNRFLRPFGARVGKPTVFVDRVGERLPISEALFDATTDRSAIRRWGLHRYLALLARTLIDPDEIWWDWAADRSRPTAYRLRRRYLKRFVTGDEASTRLVVFEWSKHGWRAEAVLAPEAADPRLGAFRGGALAYRRKK